MRKKTALCLVLILFSAPELRADFKLLDSIEEFGEKRFVRSTPAPLHAGPVKFHPTLRTSAQYDDNILLEPEDKREDVVFNIQPGAIIEVPLKTHQVAVGYEADFEMFSKERHHQQNDQNQNFFALGDFRFPNWYVNVLEYFSETSSRSGTTFTQRIPRYDQSVNPKIGYKWKRVTFESGFRHYIRDFRRQIDDSFDFQSTEITETVYYDLFARLKALLEYQWGQIDYDDNQSRFATINQVRLGLEGELKPNLFAKLRIGPQFRNYRTSSEPDFYSIVATAIVEYQIRKDLKLRAKFSREPAEATFGEVNFYTEHLFGVGFDYLIRPRWTLYHDTSYFRHRYEERETLNSNDTRYRRDGHLFLKTGLRYAFREWWSIDASYQFLHRNSNFSAFDYNDNRFILSSDIAY